MCVYTPCTERLKTVTKHTAIDLRVCVRACVRVCVCERERERERERVHARVSVCGSLHCINELVTVLKLTLQLSYTADCNVLSAFYALYDGTSPRQIPEYI